MNLENWEIQAQETVDELMNSGFTRENATLLASSLNILSYDKILQIYDMISKMNEKFICEKCKNKSDEECVDYVPNSIVDEKVQEYLDKFVDYMNQKSQFQTTNVELHNAYALEDLKKMLKVGEEIALLLYNNADYNEKESIKNSYQNIVDKF